MIRSALVSVFSHPKDDHWRPGTNGRRGHYMICDSNITPDLGRGRLFSFMLFLKQILSPQLPRRESVSFAIFIFASLVPDSYYEKDHDFAPIYGTRAAMNLSLWINE